MSLRLTLEQRVFLKLFTTKYQKSRMWILFKIQGSNPHRFIMFPKNGGDLCAHWAGGASTYRFVCALAQSIFFELPLHSLEVTKRTHTTPKQPARACARRIVLHHSAIGAYEAVLSHHALRACEVGSRKG